MNESLSHCRMVEESRPGGAGVAFKVGDKPQAKRK